MSKIKPFLFFAALIAGLSALYSYGLPALIRHIGLHYLQAQERPLQEIALPRPTVGLDYLRFDNVSLDPDSINTLGSITFLFTPQGLLSGHFRRIIIEKAELIASIDEHHRLIFDGWMGDHGLSKAFALTPQSIQIRDTELTLLTEAYGGITLHTDLSATLTGENNGKPLYDFQSRFETQQRYLSLTGSANGSFSSDFISAEAEFERGKLSIPAFSLDMTRLSGWGRLSYSAKALSLFSELRAGGMRLGALPWRNASMTYRYEHNKSEIFLSAQSLGIDGIELALNSQDGQISTRLHTPSQDLWNDYVALNSIEGEELEALVALLAQLNTEIELE